MVLFRSLLLLACLTATACADAPAPDADAVASPEDELLATLDADAFRAAFAPERLAAVTRATRVTEWTADGEAAVFERAVRIEGDRITILSADTTGAFSDNLLAGWAPSPDLGQRNPADDVLPEDAAFLSPRNRDAYRRTRAADTLLLGRPTRVVAVEAVPGEGDDQAVRRARLYLDAATGRLVALRTERSAETLLFDERGTAFLQTQRLEDGTWVPYRTVFDTEVKTLLRPARRFTAAQTFTAPVVAGAV